MAGAQAKQRAHLALFGNVMEPVAVREAQKAGKAGAYRALEFAHAGRVGNVQIFQRLGEPVRIHQQRRFLKMRNQKQQKMLVPELRQHTAFGVDKKCAVCIAQHQQVVAAAQIARVRRSAAFTPEAVVAKALFKVAWLRFGVGRARVGCGVGRPQHQRQADEVVAAHVKRTVHGQKSQLRHAVVLDLPVAQAAGLARMVAHQRFEQPRPVRGHARGAVLADMRHEHLALAGVRLC